MAKKKRIYMDYAATTPTDPRVIKAMLPYFNENFGNTMSLHSFGQKAKIALEESREKVANLMKAKSTEVIFTSSATESNNLALKGIAFASFNQKTGLADRKKGRHIIISPIEHSCVMETAKWLERQGFRISKLRVDKFGLVNPKEVKDLINKDTVLVSVMHANNEIGTIEPIEEIGAVCKKAKVFFHTDAAQSLGKIPIDVNKMNIDLLTGSSQKMYGPKGAACLFVREGVKIEPLLHGGGHESGLRASTVNVPAIVGFAKACELCRKEMKKESKRLSRLRDKLIFGILKNVEHSYLTGHPEKRLPNNANFVFSFIEGESLVIQLDLFGVAASTGSACSSEKLESSHVLSAVGTGSHRINGSLRLSLGRWTKKEDIDYILGVLPIIIRKLRKISPFSK
jgi:cysteine desulfurase